jgi:histidine triad (HIT) family protein
MDEECTFCAIRDHNLGTALYEDDACFAILDKFPAERGHVLIISKVHSESFLDASDDAISHMFVVAKRFVAQCIDKLDATGVSVVTNTGIDAGQVIFHFHIHVIPKYPKKPYASRYTGRVEITPDDVAELSKLLGMRHQ